MNRQPKQKLIHKEKAAPSSPQPAVKTEPTKPKKATNLHQLPTIQNMLEIPSQERADRVNKYFEQVKPFLTQFMQKKQGSRVLQLMFKWGGDKIRNAIHKCVLNNWKDLVRSKFALYILEKIGRDVELPGAVEDAILLQSSWEGARILQECIHRKEENLKLVKQKFYALWEKSKQGDIKSQQTLHNLALKSVDKSYDNLLLSKMILRLAIPTMFPEEKAKTLAHLAEKVGDWVGDDEGVRLFIELINCCDAKLKKVIIKAFKGHVNEIIELNNPTYVALIKLLTEVDDTVQLEKSLLPQIQGLLPLMITNKHAFSIVFSLFSPRTHNFNILGKYEHIVRQSECKKSEQQRKKQLRIHLYDPLIKFLQGEKLYQILRHHVNNKLIVGIYKSLQEDNEQELFNSFVSSIAKIYLNDAKDTLKLKSFEDSLCADMNANKIIKGILWLSDQVVDYYCDEFAKLIVKNMEQFLTSRAGFVLLGLVEKGGRDYLLSEVGKNKSKLRNSPVGKHFSVLLGGKND